MARGEWIEVLEPQSLAEEIAEWHRKAAERYHCQYMTNDEIYNCPDIEIVVNLTNVWSHHEVTKAALEHGKHVYCEKMAAETFEQAKELYDLAQEKGLMYAMAPGKIDDETLMETFFQNALWGRHKVEAGDRSSTFIVDGKQRFRICLEHPKRKNTDVLYALSGIAEGAEQEIPIWVYGFLY